MNIHCNGKQYFFSDEEPDQDMSVDERPVQPVVAERYALIF